MISIREEYFEPSAKQPYLTQGYLIKQTLRFGKIWGKQIKKHKTRVSIFHFLLWC